MTFLFWCAGIILAALLVILITAFVCFMRCFYSPKRKKLGEDEYELPEGEIYEAFREPMIEWVKMTRATPHEEFEISSFDGLKLKGKYYEYAPGAPIEIQFHGYKGYAERDLSAGVERCFALGRSVLIVDQRAHGESEGHVISFGINERRDALAWTKYVIDRFGEDVKIILTGISMGAATVVMASGEELPENVVCILSDCGYTSPKEIIKKVIGEMGLPPALLYPFCRFGARIFGNFDLEETSPIEAVKRCRVPIIIFHGDKDDFVPHEMSERLYEACPHANKHLSIVHGAGHGLAFPTDMEGYLLAMRETAAKWNL